ncbi:hypothetical protein [Kribbella pratensis]|uniref:Uncharacterized protein n=1 Tax=Kribbella pratensis TaxID=2512112 RepID=A0A4R8C568_9ACTN|nr:hypothetical protein [Kribbella pratensis]TDW70714.1 hypothetical protein EV653_4774 [Kribbella pratensis]
MTVQQPPEPPKTDLADKLLAGGVSSIPLAGGLAAAWYQHLMEGPYNKRLEAWRATITDAVNELAEKYDDLLDNEVFLDAFVNATRAAQATHQQEKLDALRNAVLNSVASDAPDVDEQARFFRLVEQFSAAHVLLLARLGGGHRGSIYDAFPEPDSRREWRDLLIADLAGARLINVSIDGFHSAEVTGLGRRFLGFISEAN